MTENLARRSASILGSFLFLLLAPGMVAGVIPWWIAQRRLHPALLGVPALRVVGVLLIAAGTPVVLDSFVRFAVQGLGTPAPVFPTRHMVVTGLYRYVRNPMYMGVGTVICGQGLLLGDVRLFAYAVLVWGLFYLFVLGYEEPKLRRSFGDEYREYSANVPRWLPRTKPWTAGDRSDS
jgi:protein-S-isoprenylcysteine O-methyltransferase Ste14